MRNHLIFVCLIALVAAPVLAGCASNNTSPSPSATPTSTASPSMTPTPTMTPVTGKSMELKMGVLMPLTGALNTLGPDMQKGAQLAIKDVNDATATTGLSIKEF